MRILFLIGSLMLTAIAQADPVKAVDSLKTRLTLFYDCYVTGNFRQADAFVAPESKDAFFNAAKERYRAYDLSRIEIKDNGNTAEVTLTIDTQFLFGGKLSLVKMPVISHWRKIGGEWFWYAPSRDVAILPFADNQNTLNAGIPASGTNPHGLLQPPMRSPTPMIAFLDKPVLTLSSASLRDVTHLRNTSSIAIKFNLETDSDSGIQFAPYSGSINPGASQTIEAFLVRTPAITSPRTMHAAYIKVHSGIRLQFYVAIEPAPLNTVEPHSAAKPSGAP